MDSFSIHNSPDPAPPPPELSREEILRRWAPRRKWLPIFHYCFAIAFLGVMVFAEKLFSFAAAYPFASRVVLGTLGVAAYGIVLGRFCRCPRCNRYPGHRPKRIGEPAHVGARDSPFEWRECRRCGAELMEPGPPAARRGPAWRPPFLRKTRPPPTRRRP